MRNFEICLNHCLHNNVHSKLLRELVNGFREILLITFKKHFRCSISESCQCKYISSRYQGNKLEKKRAHVDLIFYFSVSFLRKAFLDSLEGIMLSEISHRSTFMMTAVKFLSNNSNIFVMLVLVSIDCPFHLV